MQCTVCYTENRSGAHYCRGCGANLSKLLDLCFVMDATGSMGRYMKATGQALETFARRLSNQATKPDMAYSLVLYRDHKPHDTHAIDEGHIQCFPFSNNIELLQQALHNAKAEGGGGDGPEAVADGLYNACYHPAMRWREQARKMIFLVGDAAPHGFHHPRDNYPKGCPCENLRGNLLTTVRTARQRGIVFFCLGIGDSVYMHRSFEQIAEQGGGQYASIGDEITLIEHIQALLTSELNQ